MRKSFKLTACSLFGIFWLCGLLAACGEDTPRPEVSSTSPPITSSTPGAAITTQLATPVPATVAPFTPTPVPTATPLPPTVTPVATIAPTIIVQKGPPVVGDLPAPPQARKLNLTLDMLQRLQKRLGGKPAATDLSGLAVGAYATTDQPVDTLGYYRAVMSSDGWTETHKYNNLFGIYFEKGSQVAIVNATGIPDETTVDFLAGFIPDVKGQVKGGEVLVLLGQGPPAVFELLIK